MWANDYGRTEAEMSIFPTRILLATDGSVDSELALSTTVDLANSTNSELHVVQVVDPYYPDLQTLRNCPKRCQSGVSTTLLATRDG
jgi:Universal stress protein family